MKLDTELPYGFHLDIADPEVAIQYGVKMPDGTIIAYGDQSYVAYGEVLKDHPDGVIVRRTIRLVYGGWYPKQQDETPGTRLSEVGPS